MKQKNSEVCAITGAGRGIGLSIAEYLLERDYKVAVLDINVGEALEKLGKEKDDNLFILETDITHSGKVSQSFEKIEKQFGDVDILINNAGILNSKKFTEESEKDWDQVMGVNLKGVFLCCKAVVPAMIEKKYGVIVNIASISSLKPSIYSCSAYCASKAGMVGFSRCLASQVAKHNIRVNCVAPSTVETPMIDNLGGNIKEDYVKRGPLGRLAKPIDITNAVYFLISKQSDYITGEIINVNGGTFMP